MNKFVITYLLFLITASQADVKLPALFSDNMVIQQKTDVAVWGWADPQEEVIVESSWGSKVNAKADQAGKWMLKLPTPAAGGPFEISIKGKNSLKLKNVLAGEVWLCSGQSNMAFTVRNSLNYEQEAADASYPNIRHFNVERHSARKATTELNGNWQVCSSKTVGQFSGVAYFYARELYKKLNVPIGLIHSSWGGTGVDAWTPMSEQKDDPLVKQALKGWNYHAGKYDEKKARLEFEANMKEWSEKVKLAKKENKKRPRKPIFKVHPYDHERYPGNLYNGMIEPLIPYTIKGALWYQGENNARGNAMAIHYRTQLVRLVKSWRQNWSQRSGVEQDFAFYSVQLPNFQGHKKKSGGFIECWPAIREGFLHAGKELSNYGTAITIDLGMKDDIHPRNKQGVGKRLAMMALSKTYGQANVASGPVYKRHSIKGNEVILEFDYTGAGLMSKGSELNTFEIAGEDKVFIKAQAKIVDNKVIVSSDRLDSPIAVRYAWANNPENCNLYNKDGLPASPFRTDNWPLN